MAQLSDTQLLLLSKAAQRDDQAVQLPKTLKGGAAGKGSAPDQARPGGKLPPKSLPGA